MWARSASSGRIRCGGATFSKAFINKIREWITLVRITDQGCSE